MNIEKRKRLSSNMEDYLEAVAALKKENGVARVRDISHLLNVKSPSVNAALQVLSRKGFIIHEKYGYVDLTSAGKEAARQVQDKHDILRKFLVEILSIDQKIATKDACQMEHSISPQTFKKLTKFIEFVKTGPQSGKPDWLKSFDYYFKTGKRLKCKMRQVKKKTKTNK